MNNTTVLIHSGGLDSTTALYELLSRGQDVRSLSFNYGQRHVRELAAASEVCSLLGVPHVEVDVSYLGSQLLGGSSQTSPTIPVPHGHYAAENMKATVVPNRNMIMLALAAGYAIQEGIPSITYAAHAGDHTVYPDCRPAFVDAMRAALAVCHFEPLTLQTPFLHISKAAIVERGLTLGVPFSLTRSCYEASQLACGRCGTCIERLEAFEAAKSTDPLEYSDRDFWRSVTK